MTPIDLSAIEARLKAATPYPWCYNSYSGIYSVSRIQEHAALENQIPDDAPEDAYDGLPETSVAHVPVRGGDTATAQGEKDAELIAHAPSDLAALLELVRKARQLVHGAAVLVHDEWDGTGVSSTGYQWLTKAEAWLTTVDSR